MKKKNNPFGGIIIGIIFIIGSCLTLIINEHNNVNNIKDEKELTKNLIEVKPTVIDSKNNNKLVYTKGSLSIEGDELKDSVAHISIKANKLVRLVEMYQWIEDCDEDENNKKSCTYTKEWKDELVDSSKYETTSGHMNPTKMPYESVTQVATNVKLGAYNISDEQLKQLPANKNFTDFNVVKIPVGYQVNGNMLVNSANIDEPEVGDIRITYTYNDSEKVTVLAMQSDEDLIDYSTKQGRTYNKLVDGVKSSTQLINNIKNGHKTMTWILRIGGLIICCLGFMALLSPASAILGKVPVIGNIVNAGTTFIGFGLGTIVSLLIIATSWILFRPLLAIGLLLIIAGIVVLIVTKVKSSKKVG